LRKQDFSPTLLDFGPLQFFLARHFGFCYGVENAIEISYRALEENPGKEVYLLSQMIHNQEVNADLEGRGIKFIADTDGTQFISWEQIKKGDIVIIPAFGTTLEIENLLLDKNVEVQKYNTTCPFVEKVWNRAEKLGSENYTIIIHGKPKHEETRATFSHSAHRGPSVVVQDMKDAERLAAYMKDNYPEWLKNLQGNRPPLSIDIVSEFLLPILERDKAAVFIVVDCLRLDQWRVLEPLLAPFFDVETTHYYAVLPTATPYSRNSLFSGLFPGEIAARLPDWWGNADREDESLNAHERELLESHLEELCGKTPVRYQKISTSANSDELERHLGTAIGPEGVSAFVFNFVDLLTHGRSESQILYEVARDEIALRQITRQWFQRSALFSVLKEASRRKISVLLTTDHGSIHCNTPATVYAKRDASANLRYKFGEDLRAERPEQALLFPNEDMLRLPRRGAGGNTLLATNDCFFVYPTKLREYQSRYRGSFLHGGVTPEEVILPLALLTPRR